MAEEKKPAENIDEPADATAADATATDAAANAEAAAAAATADDDLDARLKALENAEKAIDSAYSTGKAERAAITQSAQLDAAEAVAMAGLAMEADVKADEAMRITVIAEKSGDRERIKEARKKASPPARRLRKSTGPRPNPRRRPTTPSSSARPTRWASCASCKCCSPATSPCTSCGSC